MTTGGSDALAEIAAAVGATQFVTDPDILPGLSRD
jgi:hypothetical protein